MSESLLAAATRRAGGPRQLIATLGEEAVRKLLVTWRAVARPEQLPPPGSWLVWLVLAGRGWGKTRTGAEFIKGEVAAGRARRIALVAPTAADARDTMVEGTSGILSLYRHLPSHQQPVYFPSKRRISWPNGARATLYSAEKPDRLRGPQHDCFWADELAAWADAQAVWDQLQFGLRLGNPRGIVTTTPRAIALVRALLNDVNTAAVRGSTYENAANLAPAFLAAIRKVYEGTRLGRQEIHAEILDDNPSALWKMGLIEATRVRQMPNLIKVAGGVDPATSATATSAETGIVFAGVGECRCKGESENHGFVFDDRSGVYTPEKWARAVADGYGHHHADRIIGEVNNGGDLVESNLRSLGGDANISFTAVHASRGKQTRAEPIASLYEQQKVHHVGGLPKLEDQMTQWDPLNDPKSPDRMDALVWVLTYLMLGEQIARYVPVPGHLKAKAKRRW